MRDFVYYTPTKIFFGKGKENDIGKICEQYGYGKVFIVYGGQSAVQSGLIDRVEKSLSEAGIVYEDAGGVQPNPIISKTREIIKQANIFNPDLILAVGGGSVIDTAKTVGYCVAMPGVDVWDYFAKKATITKSVPIAAILTIAAAGSEMSDSCVQTNMELDPPVKCGTNSEFNRCKFAILDPELTFTLPKFQIGSGAADIFFHTADRYFTTDAITGNHMSDEIAEGLMRNIIKYGPIGVNDPTNYEAMSEIMWSSTISHNDLTGLGTNPNGGRGGDWAPHQLGQAMSALYDATHGASMTAIWASWAKYCMDANVERFARYGRNVWGYIGDDETVALEAIEATEDWFRELGQPTSLSELLDMHVSDAVIKKIASNCSRGNTRTIGQLKVLNEDDMINIYKMAR